MSKDISWKSTEILKVTGSTLKGGIFQGSRPTENGLIVADNPTSFSPSYIAKVFESITNHIPLYIDHSVVDRRPVGYAFKFGVSSSLDDVQYTGFVFDKDAKQKIVLGGYTAVSPEIEGDDTSPALTGIAFVRNPAISDTGVSSEMTVFSTGEGMTETTEVPVDVPVVMPVVDVPRKTVPAGTITTDAILAEMKVQLDEYKSKFEAQAAKTEQLLTAQYDGVVRELKTLGYNEPGKIVQGLPLDQKISVLSKLKENDAKSRPMAKPTESQPPGDQPAESNDAAVKEVLSQMGYTMDEYKKLTGGS